MPNRPSILAAALALLLAPSAALAGAAAAGDDPHAACRAAAAAEPAAPPAGPAAAAEPPPSRVDPAGASVKLLEIALLDQDGRTRRFRSDAVGDRLVVMDFVFTTCTTICPLLSAKMARVQALLGDRAGRDVALLSVTVDPVRDTPARLEAYARRWKAGPGWTFLTGPKADVDAVLKGVGAYTASFADHPPMFLVGDGRTGRFVRLNGFPDAERIVQQVEALAAARAERTAAAGGRP